MKKTQLKIFRNIFSLIFMCLFFVLNSGCGLETYIVIDAPITATHVPNYTYLFDESYFEFWTNEQKYSDCVFVGTDVYYKIYSSYSTMTTECSALETIASSSTTSSNAPDKLMSTYSYKRLKVDNSDYDSVLIPASNSDLYDTDAVCNQKVYIRLTDYQNLDSFAAKVTILNSNVSSSAFSIGQPLRNCNDSTLTFNFGRSSDNATINKVPVSTDSDVKYSSVSNSGVWYVAMFAIAYATGTNDTVYYSNILYLGSVAIDSESYDN